MGYESVLGEPWVFACFQPLLAEADGKVGTTVSLMLVLCICLVPWTLHLSPLALPKHHLLAMSLLRSGGSRMGSSSGKAGEAGKAPEEKPRINWMKEVLALLK